jgi:hypothetical protein
VLPNSPAHIAGLVPFFDLITAVDQLALSTEGTDFFRSYIKRSKGKEVVVTLFNLRIRAYRDVPLTPTDEWGGVGLLGCTIEWSSADACLANSWHIVDVFPGSAASRCDDIMQQRDYIVGMQGPDEPSITMFKDEADFHSRMDAWKRAQQLLPCRSAQLLLMIFDSVDNSIKEVPVAMDKTLSLGIDVANGYLHLIPCTPGSNKIPAIKKFFVAADVDAPLPTPQKEVHPAPAHFSPPLSVGSSTAASMALASVPEESLKTTTDAAVPVQSPHALNVAPMSLAPLAQPPKLPMPLSFPSFPPPPGSVQRFQ